MEHTHPFRQPDLSDEATVLETFNEDQSNTNSNIRLSVGKSQL